MGEVHPEWGIFAARGGGGLVVPVVAGFRPVWEFDSERRSEVLPLAALPRHRWRTFCRPGSHPHTPGSARRSRASPVVELLDELADKLTSRRRSGSACPQPGTDALSPQGRGRR
jgi:hypothetical protein